jgi:hypothetical protein
LEGEIKVAKVASFHSLHEHPGVWWNPFGEVGVLGIENGLDTKIFDKDGSFLKAEIREVLGKILEETGQFFIIG